jgi:hypothetical protein
VAGARPPLAHRAFFRYLAFLPPSCGGCSTHRPQGALERTPPLPHRLYKPWPHRFPGDPVNILRQPDFPSAGISWLGASAMLLGDWGFAALYAPPRCRFPGFCPPRLGLARLRSAAHRVLRPASGPGLMLVMACCWAVARLSYCANVGGRWSVRGSQPHGSWRSVYGSFLAEAPQSQINRGVNRAALQRQVWQKLLKHRVIRLPQRRCRFLVRAERERRCLGCQRGRWCSTEPPCSSIMGALSPYLQR